MDWIEVTARTVDDAKELALDRLGVVEDELEFEVLDEPRGGLFRRSEARIRARVKPLSREKPADRRRRRPRSERQGPRGSSAGRGRTPTAVADDDDGFIVKSRRGNHGFLRNNQCRLGGDKSAISARRTFTAQFL